VRQTGAVDQTPIKSGLGQGKFNRAGGPRRPRPSRRALSFHDLSAGEIAAHWAGNAEPHLSGGMMFGPEMEVSSLYDRPYTITGPEKDKIRQEVDKTIEFLIKRRHV